MIAEHKIGGYTAWQLVLYFRAGGLLWATDQPSSGRTRRGTQSPAARRSVLAASTVMPSALHFGFKPWGTHGTVVVSS